MPELATRRERGAGDLASKLGVLGRATAGARIDHALRLLDHARLGPRVGQVPDSLSVRAPEGLHDLESRIRQSLRPAAAGGNDPEARELVAEAGAVEAPVQIADPPRRRLLLIADAEPLLRRSAPGRRRSTIRRPLGGACLPGELGRAAAARHPRAAGATAATSRSGPT